MNAPFCDNRAFLISRITNVWRKRLDSSHATETSLRAMLMSCEDIYMHESECAAAGY
jgi:hypothetical protein